MKADRCAIYCGIGIEKTEPSKEPKLRGDIMRCTVYGSQKPYTHQSFQVYIRPELTEIYHLEEQLNLNRNFNHISEVKQSLDAMTS